MNIKLGDFGLACQLLDKNERKNTMCGTPNYISPDIIKGKRYGYSFESDIWSLGVVIYKLIIGENPFEAESVEDILCRIKTNDFEIPDNKYISYHAENLIKSIFVQNPRKRISIEKILEHPFLNINMGIPKAPVLNENMKLMTN